MHAYSIFLLNINKTKKKSCGFFMSFSVKYGKLKILYTFFSGKTQQKGTEAVITCWMIKSHSHELKIHSINLKKNLRRTQVSTNE